MRKEIPILFSTAMVQAIMAGTKTMTRRMVKGAALQWLQPDMFTPEFVADPENKLCPYGIAGDMEWQTGMPPCEGFYYVEGEFEGKAVYLRPATDLNAITWGHSETDDPEDISMDGGPTPETIKWKRAGSILWVRESCQCVGGDADGNDVEGGVWLYKADGEKAQAHNNVWGCESGKWRPSIHMPKEAARIWLEVTSVRVERLHDITQEDAKNEGIGAQPHRPSSEGCKPHADNSLKRDCYYCAFKFLWNVINGEKVPWDTNPWVWVVSFKVLSITGRPESL